MSTTVRNALVVAAVATALHYWPAFNVALNDAYAATHAVISHRMCEAVVAVVSFALASGFYSVVEYAGVAKLQTRLAAPGASTAQRDETVVALASDGSVKRFAVGRAPAKRGAFSTSTSVFVFWLAANVGLYLGLIDVLQRAMGEQLNSLHYADTVAPSVWRMLTEVAFSVWAYDFIFWWVHASWHATFPVDKSTLHGRLLAKWRSWHLQHHDHYETAHEPLHPMATFHHHFLDATLQVGINIVVQQVPLAFLFPGPRHKLSKLLHNVVVTYLLVEAHCGFDLPFMSHRLFPAVFGGSVRHQIHHQVGKVYFHQFFRYLDDWWYPAPSSKAVRQAVSRPIVAPR